MNSPSYQEYPKVMSHPQHKAAVIGQRRDEKPEEYARRFAVEGPVAPVKLPPVTVHTREQEEEAAAKGYLPNGTPDPDAYYSAIAGVVAVHDYIEYPKWKYHPEEAPVIVQDAAAEKALGPGWFSNPACVAPAEDEPPAPKPAKRAKK